MTGTILEKLFEHNLWANTQIVAACSPLNDVQLDAEPHIGTKGSIRTTLLHLAVAQQNYVRVLTMPLEQRLQPVTLEFADVEQSLIKSGEALLALARDQARIGALGALQSRDGYLVEAWVLMVQAINHATEHREQIKSLLTLLEVTPPEIDGWVYAEAVQAIVPDPARQNASA